MLARRPQPGLVAMHLAGSRAGTGCDLDSNQSLASARARACVFACVCVMAERGPGM